MRGLCVRRCGVQIFARIGIGAMARADHRRERIVAGVSLDRLTQLGRMFLSRAVRRDSNEQVLFMMNQGHLPYF